MKKQMMIAVLAMLALSGCQKQESAPPSPAATAAGAPPSAGAPPPMGDPANNPDMTGFAAEVDADKNGQLSRAEWQAQGLPESSFGMFEKGRGYVTLEDYQKNAAPAGIDIDGNGKLTVAEFKEFDRQMSARMAPGGSAPPKQ